MKPKTAALLLPTVREQIVHEVAVLNSYHTMVDYHQNNKNWPEADRLTASAVPHEDRLARLRDREAQLVATICGAH